MSGIPRSWKPRFKRLVAMERSELSDRVRQYVKARVDALRYRLGLEFPDDVNFAPGHRQPRFFFAPESVSSLCSLLQERFPEQASEIVRRAEQISRHRFDLLGYDHLDYGAQIDWHLDRVHIKRAPRKFWFNIHYLDFEETGDSKITWELNRHQHFVILAKAYRLTGDGKFAREIFNQWQHWHAENPYPVGINWASSLKWRSEVCRGSGLIFFSQIRPPCYLASVTNGCGPSVSMVGTSRTIFLPTFRPILTCSEKRSPCFSLVPSVPKSEQQIVGSSVDGRSSRSKHRAKC